MGVDRSKLYENAQDFFNLQGGVVMKLSRDAAIDVCRSAATRGLLVVMIEGGISRGGTFEARLDAIWKGGDPPVDNELAEQNNLLAANFIHSQCKAYNAFIITDAPLTGYRHRKRTAQPAVD